MIGIGLPGVWELLLVASLALLLFWRRLPASARSLGQSIVEFRRALRGVNSRGEAARSHTLEGQGSGETRTSCQPE
jgi:Sec-independent protein translocase protein TatA